MVARFGELRFVSNVYCTLAVCTTVDLCYELSYIDDFNFLAPILPSIFFLGRIIDQREYKTPKSNF